MFPELLVIWTKERGKKGRKQQSNEAAKQRNNESMN